MMDFEFLGALIRFVGVSPAPGEGEKIRRLQAAHGVIGAFEALTQ